MSDFKFNCLHCGQHLSGDQRYAGLQIVCPACGKKFIVPGTSAPVRLGAPPVPLAASPVPPPPPPLPSRPLPPPPPAQKTCGLAIASLVCSIGSFFVIPFGFIPGIICGHMAKKKIAATPGLQGRGMAKAGLIIGYAALGVCVVGSVVFFALFFTQMKQVATPGGIQRSVITAQPRGAARAEKETTDTEPDGSGWTMKLAGTATPSGAVTGRIRGQPFKTDKVSLQAGWLKFAQGMEFFADREMDVVIFENDVAKLSGQSFTVPSADSMMNPHILMLWKEAGENVPKQRTFMERYALRLEFGPVSGGKLPGKIYLCVPDVEKSFIAGTFEVPTVENTTPGGARIRVRPVGR